jgi:hypothetical protein
VPSSATSTSPRAGAPTSTASFASSLSKASQASAGNAAASRPAAVAPPPVAQARAGVLPPKPPARKQPKPKPKDEIVEVSDSDLVEDKASDEEDLHFEWAPVPSVPGLGR